MYEENEWMDDCNEEKQRDRCIYSLISFLTYCNAILFRLICQLIVVMQIKGAVIRYNISIQSEYYRKMAFNTIHPNGVDRILHLLAHLIDIDRYRMFRTKWWVLSDLIYYIHTWQYPNFSIWVRYPICDLACIPFNNIPDCPSLLLLLLLLLLFASPSNRISPSNTLEVLFPIRIRFTNSCVQYP